MQRNHVSLVVVTLLAISAWGSAAFAQPTFTKSFQPSTIGPGSATTLQFTINNGSGGVPVTSLDFTDNLPAGVTLATPANATSTCAGGTLTALDGGSSISYTDGAVAAGGNCTISAQVTSSTPGTHTNTSGALTSDAGNSGSASADLTVVTSRPGFSKSFSPSIVAFGGRSTLTFTIDNTTNSSPANDLSFLDNLPVGMTIAAPSNASTSCGTEVIPATLTAVAGSNFISLFANGVSSFPALAAGATCTVIVDVIGGSVGVLINTSGELTSFGQSSGKATAALTVTNDRIALGKSFIGDPVGAGDNVTLEFTITNLDRRNSATDIAFTDNLDAVLSGLVATSLPAAPCGAGSTLSGTSILTLNGGSLTPEASCTFSATLQVPAGAADGTYVNTTSPITAVIDGRAVSATAASDTLFVTAAPSLTKTFLSDSVGAGDTVTVEFTITNGSSSSTATAIAFTDNVDAFLSGTTIAALPAAGFCGAGSSISPTFDPTQLVVAGGNLAASDSCTFAVDLTIPQGALAGIYTNTTSALTATLDGTAVTGSSANDDLTVVGSPQLGKEFIDDPVAPGDTVTLQFTIVNNEENPFAASDITFTDDLTAALPGLTAVGLPSFGDCGAGSQLSGTTSLSFTSGSLAEGESYTFAVTLQVPSEAVPGNFTNTTSNLVSTVDGVTVTNNPASDDLKVSGLSLTKQFTDDPVIAGDTVNLEFTIDNTSSTTAATSMSFTDVLTDAVSGMTATALPSEPCGAGSVITGTSFLIFAGGNLPAGGTCTFSVTVQVPAGTADGQYRNSTSNLVATIDGSVVALDPANDLLVVTSNLLLLTKEFTDLPAAPGGSVNLEFTLTNQASRAVASLAFTDDLDATLSGLVSSSGTLNDVCGAGSQISGTSVLSFSGGSLDAGSILHLQRHFDGARRSSCWRRLYQHHQCRLRHNRRLAGPRRSGFRRPDHRRADLQQVVR